MSSVPERGMAEPVAVASMRIVWFGASVVADWDNPSATTTRAVMRALGERGHRVVFLESRNNAPTVGLLKARGSEALRAFARAYPDLHYRTYDLPRGGIESQVWFGREAAIAEAVIVQDVAPEVVRAAFGSFASTHLVKIHQQTLPDAHDPAGETADLRLSPEPDDAALAFGPAVLAPEDLGLVERSGTLVVDYGGGELSDAMRVAGDEAEAVAAGAGGSAALPFVPEAALLARYPRLARVFVVDDDESPYALARALLPAAAGARVARFGAQLEAEIVGFAPAFDAREQAVLLEQEIHRRIVARRLGIAEPADGIEE